MPSLSDLRLRFWIASSKRIIGWVDDGGLLIRHLRRAPRPPVRPYPHIQTLRIPTQHGSLDARLCLPNDTPTAALLICHGIGDRLVYWRKAQSLLREHNLVSLIFDYSGYGTSTGSISVASLRHDSQSAYTHLRTTLPANTPVFLLGFSMGTGVATDATLTLDPAPAGLILCQPFRSLRSGAQEVVLSSLLARILPNVWRTAETIPLLKLPLLIVHSDADQLFPLAHAHAIHSARLANTELAIPTGFPHPGIYLNPTLAYWQPILDFINRTIS